MPLFNALMKLRLFLLAAAFGVASASVSINSVQTVGAGDSEDNPAEVGESLLSIWCRNEMLPIFISSVLWLGKIL